MMSESFEIYPSKDAYLSYYCLNSPNRFTKLIRENEANEFMLNDGLIKTYPAKQANNIFKKFCKKNLPSELLNIKYSDTELVKMHYDNIIDAKDDEYKDNNAIEQKINFLFPFYKDEKDKLIDFIKKLSDAMFVCGYNYVNRSIYSVAVQPFKDKDIVIVNVLFEAKYYDEDFSFSTTLYHVTLLKNLSKINKKGLYPTRKSDRFEYPDRIYLFNNATKDIIVDFCCDRFGDIDDEKICILKIQSDKLVNSAKYKSGKNKFYIDSMFEDLNKKANAIFTYNNIDRSLIENDVLEVTVDKDLREITSQKIVDLKDF